MSKASRGWKNSIFKFFFSGLINRRDEIWDRVNSLNWKEELFGKDVKFNQKNNNLSRIESMKEIMSRNIDIWSTIGKGMNIQVDFVLQPVGSWCKEKKTEQEERIFFEEDQIPSLHNVYKHVEKEKYKEVKKLIKGLTDKNSIRFLDMNQVFDNTEYSDKWIFTSKFHVTDLGSKIIAENLSKELL